MADDGLEWEARPDPLRSPVLIAGFEGWNDAADAASNAAGGLTERDEGSTRFASIDPELHFDFQTRRPTVELVDGVTRQLTRPESAFCAASCPGGAVVVLRGIEPSYRWRSFCRAVVTVARETGCEMVVTL